tara:strand:- start:1590 stop:1784 length:195 start_codon:yes stop_codon:yes gene_type:complete
MVTSTKEIRLIMLRIFCMEGIWREAFLKALTPMIVIVFATGAALLPLYTIGSVISVQQSELPAP